MVMQQQRASTVSDSLELKDVSKVFQRRGDGKPVVAVDNVSLSIPKGEFITLLGPSGCGKTTTLRLIAGFETPTSGQIVLDGKDITNQPPNHRDMAMVFQSYALFPHMSVFDNIAYGLQIRKLGRAEIKQKVEQALDIVGMSGLGSRRRVSCSSTNPSRAWYCRRSTGYPEQPMRTRVSFMASPPPAAPPPGRAPPRGGGAPPAAGRPPAPPGEFTFRANRRDRLWKNFCFSSTGSALAWARHSAGASSL
jgi:ABC-type uncharacterized transport system YnjBCD ATPase subunit